MKEQQITIDNLDLGQCKEAINQEIQTVLRSIEDRPSDKRKGKVVLTLEIEGEGPSALIDWKVKPVFPEMMGAVTSAIGVERDGKRVFVPQQGDFVEQVGG